MVNIYFFLYKSVLVYCLGMLSISLQAQAYIANFSDADNRSGYTENVNFMIGGKPWFASARYHNGNDFRLGKDSRVNVPAKFITIATQGASVEMQWDIAYPKSISLSTSTSYGTPREWSIFESLDQGSTWQMVNNQIFISNSEWFTINVTPKPLVRYAFVVTGISNPRVRLNQIKIEIEEPSEQIPVLPQEEILLQGNYREHLFYSLPYQNYPTVVEVTGLENLGLNYNSTKQSIEGSPTQMGEFLIQTQASNAYGFSPLYNLLLRIEKGNQTLENFSDLTLAYNLQQYTLPSVTDQGQSITYTISNPSIASISQNILHFNDVGLFNLTATAEENENYKPFTKTISVRINRGIQSLVTDYNDIMNLIGETMDLNVTETQQHQPLRFSVADNNIATFTNGKLKLLSIGKTTLHIEADETTTYQAFSKMVSIEVLPLNTCYFENFSSKVIPLNWTGVNVNFANGFLNFGSNNGNVVFSVPNYAKVLKFDLERTNNTSQRIFNVLVSGDNVTFENIASFTPDNTNLQESISIDLSSYGNIHWIKLEKVSATTAYWRVDNIKIECNIPREITIWENNEWSNGLPTLDKKVVINGFLEWNDNVLEAYELVINNEGWLVVKSGSGINVQSEIINNGQANQMIIEDDAFVLQNDEVSNIGQVIFRKKSRPMYRNDMSIWSSPVLGQGIRAFSPETLYYRIWDYDEYNTTYRSIFSTENSPDRLFEIGKGIAVRSRFTLPINIGEEFLGNFEGVLNNGNYTVEASNDDRGFNLIGNPYPSPITLDGPKGFFAQNPNVNQIFLWTPFYRLGDENYGNNYITINKTGAIGPYIDNPRVIAPGQGFFVQVDTPIQINFNNGMRVSNAALFYRSTITNNDQFYLTFKNDDKLMNRQLIAYKNETTTGFDNQWDALSVETGENKSYSILDSLYLSIQSRGSFNKEDRIKIGYQTSKSGEMEFDIEENKGIFLSDQLIYLYDKVESVVHPISLSSYSFYTESGVFNDRFEIIYISSQLQNIENDEIHVKYFVFNTDLIINSELHKIDKWQILSLDGVVIKQDLKSNINELKINLSRGVYVIKLWINGRIMTKKVIIK